MEALNRDPLKEENAIQLFEKSRGRKPNTQSEWDMILKASYPPEQLPDRLKSGVSSQALGMQGIVKTGAQDMYNTAQQKAIDWTAGGPTGINVLQDALKKKVGAGTPEGQEIGPSDMFKQAGLTGYGSLASSLQARGAEINAGYKKYTNWIDSAISGWSAEQERLKNNATLALENYKTEMEEYNRLSDELQSRLENLTQHQQQMERLKKQHQYDLEEIAYRESFGTKEESTLPFNTDTIAAGIAGLPESYALNLLHGESPALEYINSYVDNMSQEELDKALSEKGLGIEEQFNEIEKNWNDKRQKILDAYKKEPTQKEKDTIIIKDLKEDIKANFSWEETVDAYPELDLKDIYEAFVSGGRTEDIPSGIRAELIKLKTL